MKSGDGSSKMEEALSSLRNKDVLVGRGAQHLTGNKYFLSLVASRVGEFLSATQSGKQIVLQEIVRKITAEGGRFMCLGEGGGPEEVPLTKALDKTSRTMTYLATEKERKSLETKTPPATDTARKHRQDSSKNAVAKSKSALGRHDVCDGSFPAGYAGPGNQYFDSLVVSYADQYHDAPLGQKQNVTQLVLDQVASDGGRFLKAIVEKGKVKGVEELSKEQAIEKTRKALMLCQQPSAKNAPKKSGTRQSSSNMKRRPTLENPAASRSERKIAATKKSSPGPFDVCFGRGAATTRLAGNQYFRALVVSRLEEYKNVARDQKRSVLKAIVEEVHSKGGRFLDSLNGNKEVPPARAIEKTFRLIGNIQQGRVPASRKVVVEKRPQGARKKAVAKNTKLSTSFGLAKQDTTSKYHCVGPYDVCFGQGSTIFDMPGNQYFHSLVSSHLASYDRTPNGEKGAILQEILNEIKSKGGRFVKILDDGKLKEVPAAKAIAKARILMAKLRMNTTGAPKKPVAGKKIASKRKEAVIKRPSSSAPPKNAARPNAGKAINRGTQKPAATNKNPSTSSYLNEQATTMGKYHSVGPHDVCFGQGSIIFDMAGNHNFRALVASYLAQYNQAAQGQKGDVLLEIAHQVQTKGGHFLQVVGDGNVEEVPLDKVITKARYLMAVFNKTGAPKRPAGNKTIAAVQQETTDTEYPFPSASPESGSTTSKHSSVGVAGTAASGNVHESRSEQHNEARKSIISQEMVGKAEAKAFLGTSLDGGGGGEELGCVEQASFAKAVENNIRKRESVKGMDTEDPTESECTRI